MMVSGRVKGYKKINEKRGLWDLLTNKRITIQSAYGIIYEGVLCGRDGEFLILADAKVIGYKNIAHVDLLGVKIGIIQHVHLEPKKIEPKPKPGSAPGT